MCGRYRRTTQEEELARLYHIPIPRQTDLSPAAWRHIHLNGHYTFHGDGQVIDLDAIVAGLQLG